MKLTIPETKQPLIRITARTSGWSSKMVLDNTHREVEITLPKTIKQDDVEAYAEFLDAHEKPVGAPTILKMRVRNKRATHGAE